MLESITELVVRLTDLAEAEGRVLRTMLVRSALGLGTMLFAALAMVAGLALMFFSVFVFTAERAGTAAGAAVTGVLALAIGGLIAWLGHRILS